MLFKLNKVESGALLKCFLYTIKATLQSAFSLPYVPKGLDIPRYGFVLEIKNIYLEGFIAVPGCVNKRLEILVSDLCCQEAEWFGAQVVVGSA